ncbi:cytochrome P460 family protein [Shewanella submarina]|uniref:Cytochrome P460 family protein n=1 Tax=Shewanella submarina TaxID=2016376 RepID=A0ABV7G8M0_9GAMM|nr:cytochrome P460 family protein [Shewanella submarina]MCL1038519.1 cytochrome P460 family protein [Shewanella submarina]
MALKALFLTTTALLTLGAGIGQSNAGEYYTLKNGELTRPTGYREWVYVGTPVTPNDMNNGKAAFPEHHNVYIDPASWKHWKKTGKFRDGTILIKELVSVGSKTAVSGQGYFQGEFLGLEATIKSKKAFPNEPGNWAYYSFSGPNHKSLTKTAKPFPAAACNACHENAAADDFVFTQYYPVLSVGKGTGKLATGGHNDKLNNSYQEPKASN